jgi:hypothetical protein
MNIEGGEYGRLRRLIETGAKDRIQVQLVQFYRHGIENEVMKAQIQFKLQKTHTCIFEFPFVWERWDRKA